jgi:hypothetical protein
VRRRAPRRVDAFKLAKDPATPSGRQRRHPGIFRLLHAVEAAVPAGKLVQAILDDHGTLRRPRVLA